MPSLTKREFEQLMERPCPGFYAGQDELEAYKMEPFFTEAPLKSTHQNSMKTYIGIDVSKAKLDIFDGEKTYQVKNSAEGWGKLFERLPQDAHLIFEASGGYERGLALAAHVARIPNTKLNAARVRQFASASGKLAKTDAIDAQVIAKFGETFHPKADRKPSASQLKLTELVMGRIALTKLLGGEKTRLLQACAREMTNIHQNLIQALQRQLATLERQIGQILTKNAEFSAKVQKLESVVGIGRKTSSALLALMPELGTLNRNEAAALLGAAPYDCESGLFQGTRRIRGGRFDLRRALYMAALSAAQHNSALKPKYERLVAAGKSKKLALTAVMRGLIVHCNSLLKEPNLTPVDGT